MLNRSAAFDIQHSTLNTHLARSSGFCFLVSAFWFLLLVSGFWFLVSGFWFLLSGLRAQCLALNVELPAAFHK